MLEDPINKVIDSKIAEIIKPLLEEIISSKGEKINTLMQNEMYNYIMGDINKSYHNSSGSTKLEQLIDKIMTERCKHYVDSYFENNFKQLISSLEGDRHVFTNKIIEDIIVRRSGDIFKNILQEQIILKMSGISY